jgi:hypothetical protein
VKFDTCMVRATAVRSASPAGSHACAISKSNHKSIRTKYARNETARRSVLPIGFNAQHRLVHSAQHAFVLAPTVTVTLVKVAIVVASRRGSETMDVSDVCYYRTVQVISAKIIHFLNAEK